MVALNQTVGKQIPNELILFQLLSIFGDQLHIRPESQICGVCSKELSSDRFGPSKFTTDGRSRVCLRCEHMIAVSALT